MASGGQIACEYVDAEGKATTGNYDLVSILETFLTQHPDFSYRGSPGYPGDLRRSQPLGYDLTDETEQASARKVALCLLNTGYEFASFTYDGIGYGEASEEEVAQDGSSGRRRWNPFWVR